MTGGVHAWGVGETGPAELHEETGEREFGLHDGELGSDAIARSGGEGNEGVGMPRRDCGGQESVWVEALRLRPLLRVLT